MIILVSDLAKDTLPVPSSRFPDTSTREVLSEVIIIPMAQEFITREAGNRDEWICACGNMPHDDGFFPCDGVGNEVEPVTGWSGLYDCNGCGRIIRQDSLTVIGRKLNFKNQT